MTGRRLKSRIFWPAIVCGQHSLETFCLGVFLSFAGHFVFTEVSNRVFTHVDRQCSSGIAIMVAIAALISWYKTSRTTGRRTAPACRKAGTSGGRRMR